MEDDTKNDLHGLRNKLVYNNRTMIKVRKHSTVLNYPHASLTVTTRQENIDVQLKGITFGNQEGDGDMFGRVIGHKFSGLFTHQFKVG